MNARNAWLAFKVWNATSPIASWGRVFLAAVAILAVIDWQAQGSISFDSWQTWLITVGVSFTPMLWRYINDQDFEFGRRLGGLVTFTPDDAFDIFDDDEEQA